MIEALWSILHKYVRDQLLPLLNLHVDNTASDNKNQHVLEFCSFLFGNGYFYKVFISASKHFFYILFVFQVRIEFMMVGNAHDDID